MKKTPFALSLSVFLGLALSACQPHKVPVDQGNYLRLDQIGQVKKGQTKRQVEALLGKPILDTSLDPKHWIYVYSLKDGSKLVNYRTIIEFNDNDEVSKVQVVN